MATKLYVGNLSYQMTDQELNDLFAEAGNVSSAQVVTDRYTGQSRGFRFVEMASEDEAQQSIAAINGRNVGNRTLVVNEARPLKAEQAAAIAVVAAAMEVTAAVVAEATAAAVAVAEIAAVATTVTKQRTHKSRGIPIAIPRLFFFAFFCHRLRTGTVLNANVSLASRRISDRASPAQPHIADLR